MKMVWAVSLLLVALAAHVGLAASVAPTSLTITAPPSVGMGEDITVEARLSTAIGEPLARVPLSLSQVGAVGEREMAQATTDEKGVASFLHTEFTIAHLLLRVRFAGDAKHGPSAATTRVEISGIDVPPAVVMVDTPSPLVKAVLFSILGAVWLTYTFAGSCIIRIVRQSDREGGGSPRR